MLVQTRTHRTATLEPASFRDRSGQVFYVGDAVCRGLNQAALAEWHALAATRFFPRLMSEGRVVPTELLDLNPLDAWDWAGVLEHQRIAFVSYPYEWSFGMLKDAALLHLELLKAALDEDFILKDSSAYNVQWHGTRPVFIDIPSFVCLKPGEPWAGYRQFCQMFLYPLMLQAFRGVPFHSWLRGNIDGIPVEQMNRLMSLRDYLRRGVLLHVGLQAKLQARHGRTSMHVKRELRSIGFNKALIQANVRRLRKLVGRLECREAQSEWSEYANHNSYTAADQRQKEDFVRSAVHSRPWNIVWDLGCNTGSYARIAAENAKLVVALDADHLAIERLYRALKLEGNEAILPLVENIADPSPGLGWRGRERLPLADRGRPDLVLCLALIHHLVIGANIPLQRVIRWLADLGGDLVIEFVTKDDLMAKTLLRNKEDQDPDYSIPTFEQYLGESYEIARRLRLNSGTRILYWARRRDR